MVAYKLLRTEQFDNLAILLAYQQIPFSVSYYNKDDVVYTILSSADWRFRNYMENFCQTIEKELWQGK
jgi:hypothetical protein